MPVSAHYRAATDWLELGEGFHDPVEAADFPRHALRFRNDRAAATVGLEELEDAEWIAHFARFDPLPGGLREPLALRYHGHQFGQYNPYLGDGRGFLFAQLRERDGGRLLDLGTKGSGQTPWSRGGDGRLTLKGGVREVLCTEMLEALGVDTSRSFSLVETGESLLRHDEPSPTRSSVLVRLSHSHVRIGSFQRHAFHRDAGALRRLLEWTIARHVPVFLRGRGDETPAAFVREVARRLGSTTARWMVAGFVHGVLNTDNTNVTGESFDYGPYRFLPVFDPAFTAAYFDHAGLYAFGEQPGRIVWNLHRLVDALRPLGDEEKMRTAVQDFGPAFQAEMHASMSRRLGLRPRGPEADQALVDAVYRFLGPARVPYDRFFFDWYGGEVSKARAAHGPWARRYAGPAWEALARELFAYEPAREDPLDHAYFEREEPVTLVYDRIEALWEPIDREDDWSAFDRALGEIRLLGELGTR